MTGFLQQGRDGTNQGKIQLFEMRLHNVLESEVGNFCQHSLQQPHHARYVDPYSQSDVYIFLSLIKCGRIFDFLKNQTLFRLLDDFEIATSMLFLQSKKLIIFSFSFLMKHLDSFGKLKYIQME